MKTIAVLILLVVVYANAGQHAPVYSPIYTPVIKAEYPTYAVHSPIIAAPGYGESLIKTVEVPVIKTFEYRPAYETYQSYDHHHLHHAY